MLSASASPRYAAFYCEENVWWLAHEAVAQGLRAEVAIVSSAGRSVALWSQRAARAPGAPVLWDYHVVLAVLDAGAVGAGAEVWDLDCVLGAPLPAARWLEASFRPDVPAAHRPRFRVLDARAYLETLSSDRAHMRTPEGGWHAPPPPWAPIGQAPPTLPRLLDFEDPSQPEPIALDALGARWGARAGRTSAPRRAR